MNRPHLSVARTSLASRLALVAVLCVAPLHASAQTVAEDDGALTSGPLYDALLEMDRRLFERFDERGAATSTITRFVHVWHMSDGKWRLARVLSLDHRPIPAQ